MALSWAIAGGGTGGHVTLALALGEEIARRGEAVHFIGSDRGREAELVPAAGFELTLLPSRQVMGRSLVGRALGAATLLGAALPARRALRRVGADVVLSVGGYAAMPSVLAAASARLAIGVLEPNAIPGRVNRVSARFARRAFVGFEETRPRMGIPQERVHCFGVPLRRAAIDAASALPRRKPASPFRLLVFGGSQGAHQINEAMLDALPQLATMPLEIVHLSGAADRERVACAYAAAGMRADVLDFAHDMPERLAWADVAVCRSGALTVAELALAALPALLVPYPYAADDHQSANAQALERIGAGRCLETRPLQSDALVDALAELFAAPGRLVAMSDAARTLARPDAAARVVDECARMFEEPARAAR